MVAVALVICCVHRRRRQHEATQVVPFTPRAHLNNQQTRQLLPPPEMHAATMHQESLPTHSIRPARQEALENRLIALEQEILNLTTALSSRDTETPARPLTATADESLSGDGVTTSDPSERVEAIHSEYLKQQRYADGAERPLDDLPPEYTAGEIVHTTQYSR